MIYIVSGVMRSLTSGMMQALEAGGLTAVASQERTEQLNQWYGTDQYKPNDSYMEMDFQMLKDALLCPEQMNGKLYKVLFDGLHHLPPFDYRMLFMTRDPEEIKMSVIKFYNGNIPPGKMRNILGDYENITTSIIEDVQARDDVRGVTVLDHADVIRDPLASFARLAADGWPIDICQAAAVIDTKKHRTKGAALYA